MNTELINTLNSEKADNNSFLKSLTIWILKPHVADRRLCGSEVLLEIELTSEELNQTQYLKEILSNNIPSNIPNNGVLLNLTLEKLKYFQEQVKENNESCNKTHYCILLRNLIAKNPNIRETYELVIKNESIPCAYFMTLCFGSGLADLEINDFSCYSYKLSFNATEKKIELYCHKDYSTKSENLRQLSKDENAPGVVLPSVSWLSDKLLTKLKNWSQEKSLDTEIKSLRLVNVGRYIEKYNELKEKHAKRLVDMWTESTDPLKFVYEDIGIAAYLLVLWKSLDDDKNQDVGDDDSTKMKPKVFVDLGCGNGLLVYLLNSEGHHGYGVDIRKRKIWDTLKPIADLREYAIIPSEENQFPDADWLIGNHSDELTPWIPVMAARCQSNRCNYFVLPCCPWDFTSKFTGIGKSTLAQNIPGNRSGGKYGEYLHFIDEVGRVCGFKVDRDTLRIPSTRRVCFVGLDNSADPDKLDSIKSYIESRTRQQIRQKRSSDDMSSSPQKDVKKPRREGEESNTDWVVDFRPRSPGEATRNKSNLDRSLLEEMCVKVMNCLLLSSEESCVDINGDDDDVKRRKWNKGGTIPLSEISSVFDENQLKILKSLCGGIQTVLKNCPDVFSVKGGKISLRDWTSTEYSEFLKHRRNKNPQNKTKPQDRRKMKLCFFHQHHPNGCVLDVEACKFAHGSEDLNQLN